MSDPSAFDDFRDLLDGRLDPAAAARLRLRLSADKALAAEFAAFSEVHAFTAPAACATVPASGVSLEAIDAARGAGGVRRLRPWMAIAASLLVVAAGAAALHHFNPSQGTVTLHAIDMHTALHAPPDYPIPATLATYRPVTDGSVNWVTNLADARTLAKTASRPLFVWVHHPQCPLCIALDRGAMRDPALLAQMENFVPVKINVEDAPDEVQPWLEKGWPYLGTQTADGAHLEDLAGIQDAKSLAHLLEKNATNAKYAAPWSVSNELAATFARADAARKAGRYAEAYEGFASMERTVGSLDRDRRASVGRLASDASMGLWAMNEEARGAIVAAQKLAETDEAAGARSLSEAAERFRGTPYGLDLAEVEQELRATGRFPVIVEGTTNSQ